MEHSNLDRVLYKLGWYGRYQVTQMVLIVVSVLPGSHNILSYIFVGYDGPHSCTEITNTSSLSKYSGYVGNDSSISYGKCEIVLQTNTSQGGMTEHMSCVAGNTYSEHKQMSIVSEWDLVCERASMSELTQTVFVLGQATGGIFCSSMSDRFGRKPTYIVNVFMLMVIGFVLSFAPNYSVFVAFRFLCGICQQGTDLTIATMVLETVPTEKRFKSMAVACLSWGSALILLAPIAYLLRDVSWRYLQLAVALTAAYSLILPFTLDETLRWLEANGKTKEIERILRKAAKANKVSEEEVLKEYFTSHVNANNNDGKPIYKEQTIIVHKEESKVSQDEFVKSSDPQTTDKSTPEDTKDGGTKVSLPKDEVGVENKQDMADFKDHDVDNESEGKEADPRDDLNPEDQGKVALLRDQPETNQTETFFPENMNGIKTIRNGEANGMIVTPKATKKYTVLDILKNKLIFKNAVITWYCWVVDSLVYYGLYMTSSALSENRYLNYFLNSAVEVPAAVLVYLTLERFGRRRPSLMFHATAGISLLVAVLLRTFAGDYESALVVSVILNLLGKLVITTGFGTLFIYTPELFPTNLRNAGLGVASSVSRLGGMVAPFAGTLEKTVAWAPGAIFAGMCLLAGFLIQFLPETRGHELPLTMEEIREWYRMNLPSKKQKKEKQLQQLT